MLVFLLWKVIDIRLYHARNTDKKNVQYDTQEVCTAYYVKDAAIEVSQWQIQMYIDREKYK